MKVLISVVIPVYNTEKLLNRCVDSLLSQEYSDFELILIDDGSTDNSPKICDDYAQNDKRVRVFHKSNGGVSSARNIGVDNAHGDYIWFIDSDDFVESESFATISKSIKESNRDIYEFAFFRNNEKKALYNKSFSIYSNKDIMRTFLSFPKFHLWNKILRRTTIGDTRFLNKCSIGEDFLFLTYVYNKSKTYSYIDTTIYQYFDGREGSAMTTLSKEQNLRNMNVVFRDILNNRKAFTPQNFSAIPILFINKENIINLIKENADNYLIKTIQEIRFADIIESNCTSKRKIILLAAKIIASMHI